MNTRRPSSDVTPSTADAWFAALDHQRIDAGAHSWETEVAAVHTDGSDWWIQLCPVGHPEHALVLHLSGRATLRSALDALRRHSRSDDQPWKIVHVTRAA